MITGICTPTPSGIRVTFTIPDYEKGTITEEVIASSPADAKRRMYFRLRNYITDTLFAWLTQRWHAIAPYPKTERYTEKVNAIQVLLNQIESYRQTPYRKLVEAVCRQRDKFDLIAPRETSRYRAHYTKIVLPILEHCREMKGETE